MALWKAKEWDRCYSGDMMGTGADVQEIVFGELRPPTGSGLHMLHL